MSFEVWTTSGEPEIGYGESLCDAAWDAFAKARADDRFHVELLVPGSSCEVRPGISGQRTWVAASEDGLWAKVYGSSPNGAVPVLMRTLPSYQEWPTGYAFNPNDALLITGGYETDAGGLYRLTLYGLARFIKTTHSLDLVGLSLLLGRPVTMSLDP